MLMLPSVETPEQIKPEQEELECLFSPQRKVSLFMCRHKSNMYPCVDNRSCNTSDGCKNFQSLSESSRGAEPWNLKPFTTDFRFQNQRVAHQVLKIKRFSSPSPFSFSCSNSAHVPLCSFSPPFF
jgi:hypothetical protein